MSAIRNFLAGIGCLIVLAVLLVTAVYYWDDIHRWLDTRTADVVLTEPTPELAELAEEKIRRFAEGPGEDELRLSEAELQSWVQFRLAEGLPEGVYAPRLVLKDSTVEMSAELDLTRLSAGSQAADGLRRFMGDSTRITTELQPRVTGIGEGAVTVLSLQAGLVPVPPLGIPFVLRQAGFRTDGAGRAVLFHLPPEISEIRVEGSEVILTKGQ